MFAWLLFHADKVSLHTIVYQLITNRLGPLNREGGVTLAISLAYYGYARRRVLAVDTRESLCCHGYYFLFLFRERGQARIKKHAEGNVWSRSCRRRHSKHANAGHQAEDRRE